MAAEYISLVVGISSAILLLVIAVVIKYYKGYWLISGYNTLAKENKKNVDIKNLGKFIANILICIAGIVSLATVFMFIKQMLAAGLVFSLIIPLIIYTLLKAQTYDGNTRNPDGTTKKTTKVILGTVIACLLIIAVSVGILIYNSSQPPDYIVREDALKIAGLYGGEIKLLSIDSITIKEDIPDIVQKINGSALGNMMKGYFKLKDIGEVKLFINTQKPPFIFINQKSGLLIINSEERGETEKIYQVLLEALE